MGPFFTKLALRIGRLLRIHRGRVFISYCSEDRETAALVQKAIAKQLGASNVFWDLQVMPVEQWPEVLGTEINDCITLVLILTEAWKTRFLASTSLMRAPSGPVKQNGAYMDKEWETAHFLRKPIVPVVIGSSELFDWFTDPNDGRPRSLRSIQKLHVPHRDPTEIEKKVPSVVCAVVATVLRKRLVPPLSAVTMLLITASLAGWAGGYWMAS